MELPDDSDDRTRRDALARSLCARICDQRRGLDVLQALDAFFARLEAEELPCKGLRYILQNDQYNEDEGSELDRVKRRWWNLGMRHAIALERAFNGFTELAEAPALDLRVKHALTGIE